MSNQTMSTIAIKSTTTSAPGKLILFGEHAVVHGKVAVAAGLGLRTAVKIVVQQGGNSEDTGYVRFTTQDVKDLDVRWNYDDVERLRLTVVGTLDTDGKPLADDINIISRFVYDCFAGSEVDSTASIAAVVFLYLYICNTSISLNSAKSCTSIHARVKSQLPIGAGLGSSAAFSVALAAGLLVNGGNIRDLSAELAATVDDTAENLTERSQSKSSDVCETNGQWSDEEKNLINSWAFAAECIIHGQPSGIDNTVSCFGSAIRFQRGHSMVAVRMPSLSVYLTNTMVPRSTKLLVEEVKRRSDLLPEVVGHILTAIENISIESLSIFQAMLENDCRQDANEEHVKRLQCLVDINQCLLDSVGVGHESISKIVSITRRYNFHTKLTGAGGGGCTLTLIPQGTDRSHIESIKTALQAEGYDLWETTIGGDGVLQHTSDPEWL
eukprot:CFRG3557T1